MTCVWDGLIKALKLDTKPTDLCTYIQKNNRPVVDMLWQGNPLSKQQLKETEDHIRAIDSLNIKKGYYCSSCDPLLLLVGQLYSVNIEHTYLNSKISYRNRKAKRTIVVVSDSRHFWAKR